MPVSADTTQIAIVKETTYGVTPSTPVFYVIPEVVSESLAGNANSELSDALNANRQSETSDLLSLDVAGNIDFRFCKSTAMTLLLESLFGETTDVSGTDRDLIVGTEQISYTIEKRWPDPVNAGQYLYHRFTGCVANSMTLNLVAGEAVKGTYGIVGKEQVLATTMITGATYNTESSVNVFRGPDVEEITLDNEANTLATDLSGVCVTTVTMNFNNNYRGIQCLGTLGNKETVIGKFECSYDQVIFFKSNNLMTEFLNQGYVDETITVGDDTGDDHYTFITTKGKIASNEVVAGGTGTDVVNASSINWLLDNSLGSPTTIEISTTEGV